MTARLLLALVSILAVSAEAYAQMMMRVHARVIEKAAVRIEPILSRTPLTTLAPGAVVTVLNIDGDWVNVEFEDDRYGRRFGYMQRRSVSLPSAVSSQSAERSKAQTQVRAGSATSGGASSSAPEASPRPASASPKPAPPNPAPPNPAPVAASPKPEPAGPKPAEPVLFPEPARPVAARPKAVEAVVFPAPASPKAAATEPKPTAAREESVEARAVERTRTSSATPEPLGNTTSPEAAAVPAAVEPTPPAPAAAPSPTPLESPAPATVTRDARAGRDPVTPTKGMPLTLMIPRALLKEEGYTSGRRTPIVAADIDSPTGKPLSVNGRADWMLAGLPSLIEASVEKVNRTKNYTELELRGRDLAVKLRFANAVADPEQTLGQLAAAGGRDADAAVRYRNEAHAALARSFFPRDLANLEDERKLAILAALQASPGPPTIHLQGNRLFASFDLGADVNVYNDLDFDQAFIVAHVLNETLLARVRELSTSLAELRELSGIHVVYRIPHKHQKRAAAEEYRLELVAMREQLARFSASEITGQDFLDGAILTVDGKPVRIPLNASRR